MSYVERWVLSRRVEESDVLNWISLDFTTRQRGVIVASLDDPQSGGGSDRRIVCFDDPRIVLFHADRSIVPNPASHSVGIWNRLVRIYGEATLRCETGIESDKYSFDGRPSLSGVIRVQNRASVEAVGYTVIVPFYCVVWVREKRT